MNFRILHRLTFAFALLAFLAVGISAQDKMSSMSSMNKMNSAKTTVAIIRADWCSACQKLEPGMAELREQYKDRINFVVLDVTNDETTKQATAIARKHGLAKFFAANKKKTSTVVVLDSKNNIVFKTDHNADRDAYVRAFDAAIAKG